jgi:hypothetical protein
MYARYDFNRYPHDGTNLALRFPGDIRKRDMEAAAELGSDAVRCVLPETTDEGVGFVFYKRAIRPPPSSLDKAAYIRNVYEQCHQTPQLATYVNVLLGALERGNGRLQITNNPRTPEGAYAPTSESGRVLAAYIAAVNSMETLPELELLASATMVALSQNPDIKMDEVKYGGGTGSLYNFFSAEALRRGQTLNEPHIRSVYGSVRQTEELKVYVEALVHALRDCKLSIDGPKTLEGAYASTSESGRVLARYIAALDSMTTVSDVDRLMMATQLILSDYSSKYVQQDYFTYQSSKGPLYNLFAAQGNRRRAELAGISDDFAETRLG